jgi:hypothetical protein
MDWIYRVFAVSWIVIGAWVMVKPQFLVKRLTRKGSKKIRFLLTAVGLYLSGTLIAVSRDLDQPFKALLIIVAIVGLFKAVSLLKAAAAAKLGAMAAALPSVVLRLGGVTYILFGSWLFFR